MFQIEKRSTTIAFNDSERELINPLITAFLTENKIEVINAKELLTELLRFANSCNQKTIETTLEVIQPISVEIEENTTEIKTDESIENNLFSAEIELKLKALEIDTNLSIEEITDILIKRNEDTINELNDLALNQEVITVEKTVEKQFEPAPNQILLTLANWKIEVLNQISKNRFEAGKDKELSSIIETTDKLAFNRGNLFNWSGEFYTGLKK